MTTQQHPITPPPELVHQWADMLASGSGQAVFAMAAQWGADQELESCCEVLARELICDGEHVAPDLRMIRRPKPPSLKEQALEGLTRLVSTGEFFSNQMKDLDTIRRALEALND
jgi:hypothetical protein